MIVLLNGPFGVGKTTTARLLVRWVPDAMLYDPETIGCMLRRIARPVHPVQDYQDARLWRRLVPALAWPLVHIARRTLVIPMTVWRRAYWDELLARLRRADADVRAFRLTASEETLRARIIQDGNDAGARGWRLAHMHNVRTALSDAAFGTEIATDGRTPIEVAHHITHALQT